MSSERICRTCLKLTEPNNLFDIFGHFRNDIRYIPISNILLECTGIKMENDKLLTKICSTCLDSLNAAYDFKIQVIESEKRIESLYRTTPSVIKIKNSAKTCERVDPLADATLRNIKEETEVIVSKNDESELLVSTASRRIQVFPGSTSNYKSLAQTNTIDIRSQDQVSIVENGEALQPPDKQICSELQGVCSKNSLSNKNYTDVNHDLGKDDNDCENAKLGPHDLPRNEREVSMLLRDDTRKDLLLEYLEESDYNRLKTLTFEEKRHITLYCKVCKKSYKFRYYFYVHLLVHLGQVHHRCNFCGKRFAQINMLNQHKLSHSHSKPYSCEICGKSTKYPSNLRLHMLRHKNKQLFKCHLCDKTFKVQTSLQSHLHQKHSTEKVQFICEVCGKSFDCRGGLRSHSVVHLTAYTVQCSMCSKSFRSERCLRRHSWRHSNLRKFKCTYCDDSFKDKKVLESHVLRHTGAKPHACKLCGKTFRQKVALKTHMRSHTGEAPYVCKECPQAFKYPQQLKGHMKVHNK